MGASSMYENTVSKICKESAKKIAVFREQYVRLIRTERARLLASGTSTIKVTIV